MYNYNFFHKVDAKNFMVSLIVTRCRLKILVLAKLFTGIVFGACANAVAGINMYIAIADCISSH